MLGWISSWIDNFTGSVDSRIQAMVKWVVHALASAVLVVFNDVTHGWNELLTAGAMLQARAWGFGHSVYEFCRKVVLVWIPEIYRYIIREVKALDSLVRRVWLDLLGLLNRLRVEAWGWIVGLWQRVVRDVWAPLKALADWLWKHLVQWGYTAWWWITHPASLAESLVMFIVDAIERHAWEVAGKLGTFLLALIMKNARRFLVLLETILAAVL